MKRIRNAMILISVFVFMAGACAEEEVYTEPITTPEIEMEIGDVLSPEAETKETDTPMIAEYRYLICNPGSGVPLYRDLASGKPDTYLSRGTLVLVHEYAGSRARITFGGWKGWVSTNSLSSTDPGTGEKVGYRYAYDENGSVALYRYGFEYPIAYVPSGARVAVTDMKERGYTYVMHGAVSGWAPNAHLRKTLPEGAESHEGTAYYYCKLVGDQPGQAIQLYDDSSCGTFSTRGTLPEGTTVKVLSTQLNVRISYGGKEYYVKPRNVFREISGGSNENGVQITAPSDPGIIVPDEPETDANTEGEDVQKDQKKDPSASGSGKRSTSAQKRNSVQLKYLGLVTSCVADASGERLVATSELEFETDAPQSKQIAYIYAPKTGKCSLWKKASKKSDLEAKCKAGTVVMVLKYGSEFCRIRYGDGEGYVLTSCLRFPGSDVEAVGCGLISYKGRTTGSTTVNIRGAGDSGAHRIAEWRTGTEVLVFSHKNGWYEVECKGIHGWVQEQFLTMVE